MGSYITYIGGILSVVILAFTGCQSKQKFEHSEFQEIEQQFQEVEVKSDQLAEQLQALLLDLPKLAEIVSMLEGAGISFQDGLTNDVSNAENYITAYEKVALNLGVYSSDIAYLAVYNRIPECISYLDQTRVLADQINVTSAFDLIMIERFKDNLGQKNRLAVVVDDFIYQSSDVLRTQYRSNTAALVIAGFYIEGLYLSAEILKGYFNDPNLSAGHQQTLAQIIDLILEQKENILTLNYLLSLQEQDEIIQNVRTDLSRLSESFSELEANGQIADMVVDEIFHEPDFINMVAHVIHTRQGIIAL